MTKAKKVEKGSEQVKKAKRHVDKAAEQQSTILLKKWQNTLRLRDWDIKLYVVNTNWNKTSGVKIDDSNKQAIIMANSTINKAKLEEVVIHELLQVKLHGMTQLIESFIQGIYGKEKNIKKDIIYKGIISLLQSSIYDITKAFVELGAESKDINFESLEKLVVKEINKKQI